MKQLLTFALLTISSFAFGQYNIREVNKAQAAADAKANVIDSKFGFKDLKLETEEAAFKKQFKHFKLPAADPFLASYAVTDPKYLSIGTCKLETAIANFYKGKLVSFFITTKAKDNTYCVYDALWQAYGESVENKGYQKNTYNWKGNKSVIMFDHNTQDDSGFISFSSLELMNGYMEALKSQPSRSVGNAKEL